MKPKLICGVALALLTFTQSVWAGRPLASDDASTAEAGTCQLESWLERTDSDRALVFAPACGIAKGVELGLDYTRTHPQDRLRALGGVAVKWVPETWRTDTPVGALNFGLKFNAAFERPADAGWRGAETGVLALATLTPSAAWTVHANLGAARERSSGMTATRLNLAVVWMPREDVLLFAETQTNNRPAVFGGTVNTVGGRWWLIKDRLGLDLTAGRETGAGTGTVMTLGFGWYGLDF